MESRKRSAVFTAVDGTLLDPDTLEAGENRAAIDRLLAAGIPVIPISMMTLDELAPIATELGLRQAMVIEAGGAIARWNGRTWEVEPCGPSAETLLDAVTNIEDRSGARLLVRSAMDEAGAAPRRHFSEPFVIESGDPKAVERAAEEIGFSVRRGRRFLHLCRECDKGEAFMRVRAELQCDLAIGIGGSLVDAEFLSRVDVAVVIPGPDGAVDPELLASVPAARIAPYAAPAGWAYAVEEIVRAEAVPKRRIRRAAS